MFNKGDVAVCKENEKGNLSITIGKGYTVSSASKHHVEITNDNGYVQHYLVERFQAPLAQIKLEVGKTYVTAGDYVVHITATLPASNEYFATVETSPGVNAGGSPIKQVATDRTGNSRHWGWAYRSNGTINLGNEWGEKLRIIKEVSKLMPAPKGFCYKDGFPQLRSPKAGEWYISVIGGEDAIYAEHDEPKSIIRIVLEKEVDKMGIPHLPKLPDGYKFASKPPEHRKPKKGEWFLGVCNKPDQADADFINSSYYIISKIEEKTPETYPRYYETGDRANYAYRERVSENEYRVVSFDGTSGNLYAWDTRGRSVDDIELNKDVALGRLVKVGSTPAPPKITNLCVEIASMTPAPAMKNEAQNAATAPQKPQSYFSYWVSEPLGNMFGVVKRSVRYVVISSVLAGTGYVALNPVKSVGFVKSCIPKVHVKFGGEAK
jgi:hypothetical protein